MNVNNNVNFQTPHTFLYKIWKSLSHYFDLCQMSDKFCEYYHRIIRGVYLQFSWKISTSIYHSNNHFPYNMVRVFNEYNDVLLITKFMGLRFGITRFIYSTMNYTDNILVCNILTLNMLNYFKDYKRYIHILNCILDFSWLKYLKLVQINSGTTTDVVGPTQPVPCLLMLWRL